MGDIKGFLKYRRADPEMEPVDSRVRHNNEFVTGLTPSESRKQGARCMDCGVPFCHNGCPLGNNIPDWNDLVSRGLWKQALRSLEATNNFPEFTGQVCPAPCEAACVLGINDDPVSIESIEAAIAERGFAEGWIKPVLPSHRTDKKIAVVGSGPAGLAAAQQLNRVGHWITVYERADRPGGLLMYGIPHFKLAKEKVSRRIDLLKEEGIIFRTKINIGKDITLDHLRQQYDCVVLTCGATQPRDVDIPGRHWNGIYFADPYLKAQTQFALGDTLTPSISATGKRIIIIGGGDTGSDCVGTANRQGAKSITQFEILNKPPNIGRFPRAWQRPSATPWPMYTHMLRTSTSQQEGCDRFWTLRTKEFLGNSDGNITGLVTEKLEWSFDSQNNPVFKVVPNTSRCWPCDIALIAIGYSGPQKANLDRFGITFNQKDLVTTDLNYMTKLPGVFAAGDMRRGQSLVVWAIQEGRQVANAVDIYLRK